MTTEEAIEYIKQLGRCAVGACDETCKYYDIGSENFKCSIKLEEQFEAVEVAIKALEFQKNIIHCGECKYWRKWNGRIYEAHICNLSNYLIGENGYCLYGEKKEEE